jgi:hypothetical protein
VAVFLDCALPTTRSGSLKEPRAFATEVQMVDPHWALGKSCSGSLNQMRTFVRKTYKILGLIARTVFVRSLDWD